MDSQIKIIFDPPDLIQRMSRYPNQLDKEVNQGMEESMLHIQGSVKPYPPKPPSSRYVRTGTLGRSLTIGGMGNVKTIKRLGDGNYEGKFGTVIKYAPRVIGEGTQEFPWVDYWWHMGEIALRARDGVMRIFNKVADRLARFLDGK